MSDSEVHKMIMDQLREIKKNQDELNNPETGLAAKIESKFETLSSRLYRGLGIWVVIFLFVIGGSFTYTSRIDTDQSKTERDVMLIKEDMRVVSSKLQEEYPESVPLKDMHERYNKKRGHVEDDN